MVSSDSVSFPKCYTESWHSPTEATNACQPHLLSPQDKRRRYRMLHSQESGSSVFFHSQEEGGGGGGGGLENWEITKDPESGFPSERSSGEMGSESDIDSGGFGRIQPRIVFWNICQYLYPFIPLLCRILFLVNWRTLN